MHSIPLLFQYLMGIWRGKQVVLPSLANEITITGHATAWTYGSYTTVMAAVDVTPERPILIDRFLEDATEVDVDAIRDHTGEVIIGGVMEHVEEAGHSVQGDAPLELAALIRDFAL